MALGGLVITGQAGHTLEVEPPPPLPPNFFLTGFFLKLPLTQLFSKPPLTEGFH